MKAKLTVAFAVILIASCLYLALDTLCDYANTKPKGQRTEEVQP